MPCQVVVVAGPAQAGKSTRLLCAYRQALAESPLGATLWLAPTHRAAAEVAHQLFDGSLAGCLSPNLLTFPWKRVRRPCFPFDDFSDWRTRL